MRIRKSIGIAKADPDPREANLCGSVSNTLDLRLKKENGTVSWLVTHPFVCLPHVAGEVVHRNLLVTVRASSLLPQMNALQKTTG